MKKQSQKEKIKKHMQKGGLIHKLKAFKLFGCMTLAQRIKDIKKEGIDVQTQYVTIGSSHNIAVYYIPQD